MLEALYKEMILEHYKRPRNRGVLDNATVRQEGLNPSCGDELELHLLIDEGTVKDVKFTGVGCAISQSSASLMTEAIKGRRVEEALSLSRKFKDMIRGEPPHDDLGDLKLLQGVAKLHARVKCATLAWVALEEAVGKSGGAG
ncbi:SUF system NifU family Fe-S cluster assembly protein [soil metagenome]|jgi:nitrogen fixation NifU-like protein|nr:SUF system NifU family Fe-S cluster assembly protein [Deinococcota bacterium]